MCKICGCMQHCAWRWCYSLKFVQNLRLYADCKVIYVKYLHTNENFAQIC